MSKAFTLRPIGTVSSTRDTPIDDDWDAIPAHIDLDPDQSATSLRAYLDEVGRADPPCLRPRPCPRGAHMP